MALLGAIGAAAAWLVRSPLLAVADVQVEGVEGASAEQVRAALDVEPGASLLGADLAAARDRVAALPFVEAAAVDLRRAVVVVAEVQPRPPAAVLRTPDASWVLDSGGVLIDGGDRPGVPVIDADDLPLPPLGEAVDDLGVRAALRILPELPPTLGERISAVRLDGPHVDLVLDVAAVLPAQDDLVVRLGSADRIDEKSEVVLAMLDVIAERQRDEPLSADPPAADPPGDDPSGEPPLGPVLLDVRAPANPVLRDR